MKDVKKKKKKPSSEGKPMTAREKMMARREQLKRKGFNGNIVYLKEGVTRVRLKSPGPDDEIGREIVTFYLGKEQGSIISPATYGDPCPFMELYQKLKSSSKEADQILAKKLVPKRKYLVGGIVYKDQQGKEVDPDKIDKAIQIPKRVYQDITDYYLDEDDYGDMTDEIEGYDLKITRSGSGQMDTVYSVKPGPKKPLPKEYRGYIDLDSIIQGDIKPYDELEEMLSTFTSGLDDEEEDDEPKPKKKKKSKGYSDEDDELPF